jgi:hypothetical protein
VVAKHKAAATAATIEIDFNMWVRPRDPEATAPL